MRASSGETKRNDLLDRPGAFRAGQVTDAAHPAPNTRHVELILRQIDSLPTLPSVATRLLALTTSDESDARQVIELVSSDPTLTARILSQCRTADMGLREEVMTIERAVVLLGFNAIRNTVLSIKVFEFFNQNARRTDDKSKPNKDTFDRPGFWRHSLAVAIAAELIAQQHPQFKDIRPEEAFVCGLLHDIGKLALEHVLPKSYARVVELADLNQNNIAEFERRIIGIDHHTAGKRLAEQWGLPHQLQDCIWLHGSPYASLPKLEHRRMIGLISLADLVARRQHIGYSGNHVISDDPAELAIEMDFKPKLVESIHQRLLEQLERHSKLLGLSDQPTRELFLSSIHRANAALGKLNDALERRSRTANRLQLVLDAIAAFHGNAAPGRSVQDVLDLVAGSAANVFGHGYCAMIYQPGEGEPWQFCQYGSDGSAVKVDVLDPPPHLPDVNKLDVDQPMSMNFMGILPWLADYLVESQDIRRVRLLPLSCGWQTAAVLLHDREKLPPARELTALTMTWGAAIAGATQHDGARRLGEQLAQANRALAETQDKLLQNESLARLGEMASGAAHEMNNPLAVISGRSQLLMRALQPGSSEHQSAQTIYEQSHRLSDLITSLRLFADPPAPQRRPCDVFRLLHDTVERLRQQIKGGIHGVEISVQLKSQVHPLNIDPEQIGAAVYELLNNAIQAVPRSHVLVTAYVDSEDSNLVIQVTDDGVGMDAYTIAHAKDPFFSAKQAGRRVGMGLCRAQQFAAGHNGRVDLRSTAGQGTVATLTIGLDSDT